MTVKKIKIGNTSHDIGVDYKNVDGAPTKVSQLTNDINYVTSTDYATTTSAGVIKVDNSYGLQVANSILTGSTRAYSQYETDDNVVLVDKGTLENVIAGKNLIKNTDYATSSVGGVIKIQNSNGVYLSSTGVMYPYVRSYTDYQTQGDGYFISKGTLENWLVGKDLTTKAYVDSLVGDIESALNEILGEDE